jgi:hypothetical protein
MARYLRVILCVDLVCWDILGKVRITVCIAMVYWDILGKVRINLQYELALSAGISLSR